MDHFDPLNSKFARNIHFFIKKNIYRNLKKFFFNVTTQQLKLTHQNVPFWSTIPLHLLSTFS
jgi:hypothetical protein